MSFCISSSFSLGITMLESVMTVRTTHVEDAEINDDHHSTCLSYSVRLGLEM